MIRTLPPQDKEPQRLLVYWTQYFYPKKLSGKRGPMHLICSPGTIHGHISMRAQSVSSLLFSIQCLWGLSNSRDVLLC